MNAAADESIARMKEEGVPFMDIDRSPFIDSISAPCRGMDSRGELLEGFLDALKATRNPS